jgi:diazepam-binding inhibitor (GABA receptor modulating acyl-CoA-binding protein)
MSAFDTAVADSKKLTSKPSNDDLLELYGTFPLSPLPAGPF